MLTKPKGSDKKPEEVYLPSVQKRISVEKAKELLKDLGRHFGGLGNKLTPAERSEKARKAARIRWEEERNKRNTSK